MEATEKRTSKNTNDRYAVALDLGGTQLRAALVDSFGRIVKRASVATAATAGPDAVIAQLCDAARAMMRDVAIEEILGVGLSAPGPLDTREGIALYMPTLAGFRDIKLRDPIQEALKLPVWLENDGTAAALGEWRFGSAIHLENFVYITVSTGIGGGIVVDNRLLRGRLGMAGEVGHMTIIRDGDPCSCSNPGCWEAYASGTAFARRATERAALHDDGLLTKRDLPIDGKTVFAAAAEGDPLALSLVAEEAEFLGIGIANLLHLYSPEAIVIGGGMAANFDVLHPGILAKVKQTAMHGFNDVPIVKAALDPNSGLIGAAALVFDAVPETAASFSGQSR